MNILSLESGDNPARISPRQTENSSQEVLDEKSYDCNENVLKDVADHNVLRDNADGNVLKDNADGNLFKDDADEKNSAGKELTPQMVEENETKLKERIAQCRDIIESLRLELNEEKSKLQTEIAQETILGSNKSENHFAMADNFNDMTYSMVSASVDSKLNCDESLIAYEKQLERYQYTLNMAQMEKKNAIRKKMLAKAYKLKLMEVENQCNLELLRVKQSLQCLEPLKIIVNKWKNPDKEDKMEDIQNLELLPRFPEVNFYSGCDFNLLKDEVETDDQKALANADNISQAENTL